MLAELESTVLPLCRALKTCETQSYGVTVSQSELAIIRRIVGEACKRNCGLPINIFQHLDDRSNGYCWIAAHDLIADIQNE